MQINTRFNVGDMFYEITSSKEKVITKCETCDGTGKIKVKKKEFDCPDCWCSSGYDESYVDKGWHVCKDNEDTMGFYSRPIGEVRIEAKKRETKILYMRKNTGNLINENDCYATIEEAQLECDKRNTVG